ncbi:MAG: CpsB/CapC family capsule biosynthesis tyrosine phosphatase [Syntrophotaleaceae bacterium]
MTSGQASSSSIDWHCHILPGLDDGPETLAESLEMARILAAAGFRQVHCTPHFILGSFHNRPAQVQQATLQLQKELQRAGIPLLLSPGIEYYLDEYFPVLLEQPQTLGHSRMLLVEIPSQAAAELVRDNIQRILHKGYVPLVAHPERSALLSSTVSAPIRWLRRLMPCQKQPVSSEPFCVTALAREFQQLDCLFQGNLLSFSGYYGRKVQQRAAGWFDKGLYHHFGSDGHSAAALEAGLLPGLQVVNASG